MGRGMPLAADVGRRRVAVRRPTRSVPLEALERRLLMSGTVGTTTTIVDSADHVSLDGSDTFTATVTASVAGGVAPTGTVQFFSYNGTYPTETAALSANGTAAVTVPATIAGHIAFFAVYEGDATYATSHSGGLSVAVDASPVVLTITKDTVPTAFVQGGKPAKGSVTLTLSNPTGATITGPQSMHVYAARYVGGQTIDTTDVGSLLVKSLKIPAGGSKSVTVKVTDAADLATPADYSFTATATNGSHLTSYTPGGSASPDDVGFAVAVATVDVAASITSTSPTSLTPGKSSLSLTVSFTNSGNVDAKGTATITVSLASGGTTGAAFAPLKKPLTVKAGGAKPTVLHLKLKVPATATAGTFAPVLTFTQPGSNDVAATGTTLVTIT